MSGKPPPGHFSLLYFSSASSYTKKSSEYLKAPLQLSKLFDELEKKYPGIGEKVLSSCAVTINLDYVDVEEDCSENTTKQSSSLIIRDGDEVAIIPPVSSG
ncbi:MAG: hypothetical protein M1830_000212 [Pleopsidium flavum]|nr:MAG: hypothetical protein M1830_000212 [Pleopsidium flavum]